MKKLLIMIFILNSLFSCGQSNENNDNAYKIFNEGVELSLEADTEFENGNYEKSEELNKKAITKFHQTIQIDSTHKLAPSALGHSYYLVRNFNECINWFEKAISLDNTLVINYREYGLCKINLGDLEGGKLAIDRALQLDDSDEIRKITIDDLHDIASLAFEYGTRYQQEGENDKGIGYKRFSVGVLLIAHQIDTSNIAVIKSIAEFTEKIGDKETSNKFKEKMNK